jgi:hypothetical protein
VFGQRRYAQGRPPVCARVIWVHSWGTPHPDPTAQQAAGTGPALLEGDTVIRGTITAATVQPGALLGALIGMGSVAWFGLDEPDVVGEDDDLYAVA